MLLFFLTIVLWSTAFPCFAQKKQFLKDPDFSFPPVATAIDIQKELTVFNKNCSTALYRISICADVPHNKKPNQVLYNNQTGHVFIILQKIIAGDTLHKSFGFYPFKGTPIFFKRNVKSQVKDNSLRQYDVAVIQDLSEQQFRKAISVSQEYSKRNYHLNKFNCYDYILTIFNAVTNTDTLPIIHVRYPLFFGRGGSPIGLYKYAKQQKDSAGALAPYIVFGKFTAPASTVIL